MLLFVVIPSLQLQLRAVSSILHPALNVGPMSNIRLLSWFGLLIYLLCELELVGMPDGLSAFVELSLLALCSGSRLLFFDNALLFMWFLGGEGFEICTGEGDRGCNCTLVDAVAIWAIFFVLVCLNDAFLSLL